MLSSSKGQRKLQVETRVKTKVAVGEMHRKGPRMSGLATRRRAARGRQSGQGQGIRPGEMGVGARVTLRERAADEGAGEERSR